MLGQDGTCYLFPCEHIIENLCSNEADAPLGLTTISAAQLGGYKSAHSLQNSYKMYLRSDVGTWSKVEVNVAPGV